MSGFGGDVPWWMPVGGLLVLLTGIAFWSWPVWLIVKAFRSRNDDQSVSKRSFEVKPNTDLKSVPESEKDRQA